MAAAEASLEKMAARASGGRLRVLHLFGSATSSYYAKVSTSYFQESVGSLQEATSHRFEFLFAGVHPKGDWVSEEPQNGSTTTAKQQRTDEVTWTFPTAHDDESLATAALKGARYTPGEALRKLSSMKVDVMVPHMFCLQGMTSYRAVFDLLQIPVVGCDPAAMALSTNKARTKAILKSVGVPVPGGLSLRRSSADPVADALGQVEVAIAKDELRLPVIIKPCSEDNSMGVELIEAEVGSAPASSLSQAKRAELEKALRGAFEFDDEVLVEQFVPLGRELRLGILLAGKTDDSAKLLPLACAEYHLPAARPFRDSADKLTVDPNDAAAKVNFTQCDRTCPAKVEDDLYTRMAELGKRAHVALGCRDYSLYDVRVSPDNVPYFLEASLYCSFAPRSPVVLMAGALGHDELRQVELFSTLVERAALRGLRGDEPGAMQSMGLKRKLCA